MRYMCNACGTDVGGRGNRCAEHPEARVNEEPNACARAYVDRATGFRRICGKPEGHPGDHASAGLNVAAPGARR
jgi:hypothetical protein